MSNLGNTLRILLANFVVEILPLLLIAAAIVLIVKARKEGRGTPWKHYLGISLAAMPTGIFLYMVAGIIAARMRGDGHFYSVPFGGYSASDNVAIGFSLLLWMALVFALLTIVLRPRQRES